MYFQLVDNKVLSTQGQPDFNLHRLTAEAAVVVRPDERRRRRLHRRQVGTVADYAPLSYSHEFKPSSLESTRLRRRGWYRSRQY